MWPRGGHGKPLYEPQNPLGGEGSEPAIRPGRLYEVSPVWTTSLKTRLKP